MCVCVCVCVCVYVCVFLYHPGSATRCLNNIPKRTMQTCNTILTHNIIFTPTTTSLSLLITQLQLVPLSYFITLSGVVKGSWSYDRLNVPYLCFFYPEFPLKVVVVVVVVVIVVVVVTAGSSLFCFFFSF